MGKGGSKGQRIDITDSYNPQLVGRAAQAGTIFRYIPDGMMSPQVFLKADNGFSTNWAGFTPDDRQILFVGETSQFQSIQGAIDFAESQGAGIDGKFFTIMVAPGEYNENLTFKAGIAIIARSTVTSIGAVSIIGQHSYQPPTSGDILFNIVNLQGLTFIDRNDGNTISIVGPGQGFFSVNGCSFVKDSTTGDIINCSLENTILVITQSNATQAVSSGVFIRANSQVCVIQQCSHSSGSAMPFLSYNGPGQVQFFSNQCFCLAEYLIDIQSGQMTSSYNYLSNFLNDCDGIRVSSGATVYSTFATFVIQSGSGFVLQGEGTVNAGLNVYGFSTVIDPSLTYNELPTEPT